MKTILAAALAAALSGSAASAQDTIKLAIGQQLLIVVSSARGRITPAHRLQSLFVCVAKPTELRRLVLGKIAHQIGPPIAAADYADGGCCHE